MTLKNQRPQKSTAWQWIFRVFFLFLLAGCSQTPNQQNAVGVWREYSDASVNPVGQGAQWRALNRLAYGPTPNLLIQVQSASSPLAWADSQLDEALQASRLPSKLPSDLASIGGSLPAIFEGAKKEREARASVTASSPINEILPNEKRFDFAVEAEPYFFNRTQLNKGIAWRLTSCSDDEVEPPLLARMTEFWFNHFNVYQQKGTVRPFAGHYAIHVARAHALGRFEDLVMASAKHPAMLYYLDQWLSVSPQANRNGQIVRGLNENYARELMELHTLGVQGGYTQNDVRELAKILTGWTVSARSVDGFQFVARLHEPGQKMLMGRSIPSSPNKIGEAEGEEAIRFLARQPATAKRVSQRLAEYFVSDNPPQALVEKLTQTFLSTQGDIYQVMKVLVHSPSFWDANERLYRTPYDFACASLSTLHVKKDRNKWLQSLGYTAAAGQPPQNWLTPDGYAFNAATWLSPEALTRRIDFALAVARNAPERPDVYPYLSESSLKAVMKQAPNQRMGFVLGSPEMIYK
jgi:uncharacterized protein (DUF1800 family)